MNTVATMLLGQPGPALIWATLMLLSIPALLLLGMPEALRHPRTAAREVVAQVREHGEWRRRQAAEEADTVRYAEEVQVAAERAATGARRWQETWRRSADEVDAAWEAWRSADDGMRTLLVGSAWPTYWPASEGETARLVAGAIERGELPEGFVPTWDAARPPADQQLAIARASVAYRWEIYERAVAAERSAWGSADLARRTSDSLRAEASAAAEAARHCAPVPVPSAAGVRASRRTVPAAA